MDDDSTVLKGRLTSRIVPTGVAYVWQLQVVLLGWAYGGMIASQRHCAIHSV